MKPWLKASLTLLLCAALFGVGARSRADERRELTAYRESAELFASAATAERRGLLEEARVGYAEAVALAPDFVEAIVNLARLELSAGALPAAEAWLERAERIRADYPMVTATRGLLALAQGDLPRALDALSQAHRRAPEDAEVAVNLSAVLILRSRPVEARQVLEALLRAQPDHSEALYNLALADDLSGRVDAASLSYRRFLALAALDDPAREGVQRRLEAIVASNDNEGTDDGE